MEKLIEILESQIEMNNLLNEQYKIISGYIHILEERLDATAIEVIKLQQEVEELKGRA